MVFLLTSRAFLLIRLALGSEAWFGACLWGNWVRTFFCSSTFSANPHSWDAPQGFVVLYIPVKLPLDVAYGSSISKVKLRVYPVVITRLSYLLNMLAKWFCKKKLQNSVFRAKTFELIFMEANLCDFQVILLGEAVNQ